MLNGSGAETNFSDHYVVRNVKTGLRMITQDRLTLVAVVVLAVIVFFAAFGPYLTPYTYDKQFYTESGAVERLKPPSGEHLLGTTYRGEDVFSRLIYGARPTVITGAVGGFLIISIGMLVGVTAGYVGGRVENVLMRITDFFYGIPLIPFAITLVALVGANFWTMLLVIGAILWRGNARVLRSQVLQIKERPYIKSARASGASTPRIIITHILPNIAGMAILFFALGVGFAILFQASLAFLGMSNPFLPSWGIMIRNAYTSGRMADAWWWALPPGLLISITVLCTFLIGRGYERLSQSQSQAHWE